MGDETASRRIGCSLADFEKFGLDDIDGRCKDVVLVGWEREIAI